MGCALAKAAIDLGHDVVIVSGPVEVEYPFGSKVISVTSTEQMLEASRNVFSECNGMIGAAAPCDYRPVKVKDDKIKKTGEPLVLHLIETPDVVATLGNEKRDGQWVVGFALETEDQRFRAITKLEKKSCNLIVLNGPEAINSSTNQVEVINHDGKIVATIQGSKEDVADGILKFVQRRLIDDSSIDMQ